MVVTIAECECVMQTHTHTHMQAKRTEIVVWLRTPPRDDLPCPRLACIELELGACVCTALIQHSLPAEGHRLLPPVRLQTARPSCGCACTMA